MNLFIYRKKAVKILGLFILLLTVSSLVGQLYKYLIFNGKDRYLVKMLFLDAEFNLPTWYAAITILMCSLLTWILYSLKRSENDKFKIHWLGLSFIFFILASDEMLMFHEQIISPLRRLLSTGGFFYMAWIIPAIIFCAVFMIAYFKFLKSLPTTIRKGFIYSGVIYVIGAIGMEAVGGKLFSEYGQNNLLYSLITQLEELLEMVGILMFINTLLLYYHSFYSRFTISTEDKSD